MSLLGLEPVTNSKNKTFITFCFCFISGVSLFSFLSDSKLLFSLYIFLFIILFFIIIFWDKHTPRFLLLCLTFFILGACRFLLTIPDKNNTRVEFYNGEKVILQGFISREPDIGLSDIRYILQTESVKEDLWGKKIKIVKGNIAIKSIIYPEYKYGDRLEVECFLQEPKNFIDSNFNYVKYLARQGVGSVCDNPSIKLLEGNTGSLLVSTMLNLKYKIKSKISDLWPEPDSSLMAGILYGSRSSLPEELKDNFSRTGVSHIMAVSGYNVSIIALSLNVILIYLGLFRRQSFWVLVFLILTFVFFTGATASVVRAGVMAIIILASQHIGRISVVGRTMIYAAVIMLIFNPYLFIWDAGFQLSFLSTLGLVYLSPIIQNFINNKFKIEADSVKSILEVLVITMSAIIATLPLIMYQFGRVSIVAPLVNILILWIIPWLMLLGFLALVFSFIFFPLAQILAWVAELGIRYVIMVVNWFGERSWSTFDLRISLPIMVVFYLILILFVWQKKPKFFHQK